MIIKEWAQEETARDKYAAAGAEAERQLAHYLKRKFGDRKDVLVFNNLRIESEDGDDAAQFDHLIFHRRGFIIIESKSVTSKVKINARGEWLRLWDAHYQGMASPVLQAQRQADFLKNLLNDHKDTLRKKIFLIQLTPYFSVCPFEVLVAISDKGIIEGKVPDCVFKADQVPDEVEKIIHRHKIGALRMSMKDGMDKFPDEEMERIGNFLLERHKPRTVQDVAKRTPTETHRKTEAIGVAPASIPIVSPLAVIESEIHQKQTETPTSATPKPTLCPSCNSDRVHILYGQYGYYYRCLACSKSFNIDFTCPKCGKKAKIRKDVQQFFKDCRDCKHTELYHVNS